MDMEQIARGTPGFTGADLFNLVNQAALKVALLYILECMYVCICMYMYVLHNQCTLYCIIGGGRQHEGDRHERAGVRQGQDSDGVGQHRDTFLYYSCTLLHIV